MGALGLLAVTLFFQFPVAFIGQYIYGVSHPEHRWQEISEIGGDWASLFFVLGIAPLLAVIGLCLVIVGLLAWKQEAPRGTVATGIDNTDAWFTSGRLFLFALALLALAAVLAFLAAPDFERTALSGSQEVIPPVRWFRILTPW